MHCIFTCYALVYFADYTRKYEKENRLKFYLEYYYANFYTYLCCHKAIKISCIKVYLTRK